MGIFGSRYRICRNCGYGYHEDDAGHYREFMGYCGSAPAYEEFACCPNCGAGDSENAEKCELCDNITAEEEMVGNICKECLEASKTLDNAVAYGEDDREYWEKKINHCATVVNSFYAYIFKNPNDILRAKFEELFTPEQQIDLAKEYFELDEEAFADFLASQQSKKK